MYYIISSHMYYTLCVVFQIKKGPMKGQFVGVIKRKIPLDHVGGASLRYDRMKFMRCFNTVLT